MSARPDILNSKTFKQVTPFGNLYVIISEMENGQPYEVFGTLSKAGSDIQASTEAISRLTSAYLALDSPISRRDRLSNAEEQLSNLSGESATGFGVNRVRSLPDSFSESIHRVS